MIKYFNTNYWIRRILVNTFVSKLFSEKMLSKIIFSSIYKSNHWNKGRVLDPKLNSFSGPGSIPDSNQTNHLILELNTFFQNNKIKSFIDAPCGDCAWVSKLFSTKIHYIGIDIVEVLIEKNRKKYSKYKNVKFYNKDIINFDGFGSYDFVLLRDFFIHLPLDSINKILNNLKKSKCKYFAFNSYEDITKNKDITLGKHRKINLRKEPFNLDEPYFKIREINNDSKSKMLDNFIYIYKNY